MTQRARRLSDSAVCDLSLWGGVSPFPHAVALSKLGAKKGGKARAAALSAERRREIARKASLARWAKQKKKTEIF